VPSDTSVGAILVIGTAGLPSPWQEAAVRENNKAGLGKSMGQKPSWETEIRSVGQEIQQLLRNKNFHYCVHNSLLPGTILNHLSSTYHTFYAPNPIFHNMNCIEECRLLGCGAV
jgi:hypothetical protein